MEYQEFMELVPEETKIFVDSLLPYLSYYSNRELVYKEKISNHDTNKKLFLSLYVLSKNPMYHNLLVQLSFDRSLYKIDSEKIEEKNIIRQEVFHCMDDVLKGNDPTVFRNLTPIDIVLAFLRKYQFDNTVGDEIFRYVFHNKFNKICADNLYNQLTKYSSQIKQNRIIQIENSIYNHVPNHIISYFETNCTNLDIRYDILQLEVENEKPYEQILSIDQRIQLLSNEQVSPIDLSDITSILNFGNSLVIHSNYIHNELSKLVLSDTHDSAIQEMNHMIENTYSIESLKDSKKSFWSKIFHTQENQESQMVFDSEKIKKLQQTIEQNIETLSKEIVGYDNIRKYIEAYRQKNNTHFLIAQEAEKKIQEKLQNIDPEQDNQYSEFLVTNSQLQMIHNKVNRFATTNQLMRQELLSINQTIVNHFITINALEMARDDLMPLIGSELAISQGRTTEGQGMELTKNVMSLFQTLLSRNLSGALVQMQQLQNHLISSDTLAILNGDIKHYLNEVNQAQNIQNRVETLATDQISLDGDLNLTEKSPLENGSSNSTSQKKLKK